MSEPIQSISQGNYILQGTVATSAGIVGDGSTQNPLRADETVLWSGEINSTTTTANLSEPVSNFNSVKILCKLNRSTPDAPQWFEFATNIENYTIIGGLTDVASPAGNAYMGEAMVSLANGVINYYNGKQIAWGTTSIANEKLASIYKVIGLNRKA